MSQSQQSSALGIPIGMSLPHRAPDPIEMTTVKRVAQRAEELGFSDLWVTENTLDWAFSFDPACILTYAAAVTTRIRLGVAVVVLPIHHPAFIAHQFATLDWISGGRAILGLGMGRDHHFEQFEIPMKERVRRLREGLGVMKAIWTQPKVDHEGEFWHMHGHEMKLKPVQKPHLPVWFGGDHPNAVRRAAQLADGWISAGAASWQAFSDSVKILREELEKNGRDPAKFPISKRAFLSVDENPKVAKAEMDRWYREVYRRPAGAAETDIYGTPEQVREKLEALVGAGANHLLVNPAGRYEEQVDALAQVVGLA